MKVVLVLSCDELRTMIADQLKLHSVIGTAGTITARHGTTYLVLDRIEIAIEGVELAPKEGPYR